MVCPRSRRYFQTSGEGRNGNACIAQELGPRRRLSLSRRKDTQRALLGARLPRWLKKALAWAQPAASLRGFQFPAENPAPSRPPPGPGLRLDTRHFHSSPQVGRLGKTAWVQFPRFPGDTPASRGPCPPPFECSALRCDREVRGDPPTRPRGASRGPHPSRASRAQTRPLRCSQSSTSVARRPVASPFTRVAREGQPPSNLGSFTPLLEPVCDPLRREGPPGVPPATSKGCGSAPRAASRVNPAGVPRDPALSIVVVSTS